MSVVTRLLSEQLRQRHPTPVLAFDARVTVSGVQASFGIPFPWRLAPRAMFVGPGALPLVAVHAPRTDDTLCWFAVWQEPEGPDVEHCDYRTALRGLAGQEARPVGVRRLHLGPAHAAVLIVHAQGRLLIEQVVVNYGSSLLRGQFEVRSAVTLPDETVLAYAVHFETMLGSWAWTP